MPRSPGLKVNGAAIRAIREANGWNSTRFCAALEISGPHLTNIEKGARNPSPELARRMAEVLAVPLAAIRSEHWLSDDVPAA